MSERGRPKRSWVKLDCNGIIHGSINWQLTLEEQAVWIKSFAYSAVCGGTPGIIQDNDGQPLPHQYIAEELHCPVDVFESMLEKCKQQNRLRENAHGIEVINFNAYQFTEYDRQKPYREAKAKGKKIFKICHACGYKARTDEEYCPECEKEGKEELLAPDYRAGKYGHMMQG